MACESTAVDLFLNFAVRRRLEKSVREAVSFHAGVIDHAVTLASELHEWSDGLLVKFLSADLIGALRATESHMKKIPSAYIKVEDPSCSDVLDCIRNTSVCNVWFTLSSENC
jgi:hypothetical protein